MPERPSLVPTVAVVAVLTGAVGLLVWTQWRGGGSSTLEVSPIVPLPRTTLVPVTTGPGPATPSTGGQGPAATSSGVRSGPGTRAGRPPSAGPRAAGPSPTVPGTLPGCAGACVSVVGTEILGPESHVAQGFNHGTDASTNPALVDALQARQWMLDSNGSDAVAAASARASVSYMLDTAWDNSTAATNNGNPVPPWQDLSGFAAFVKSEVSSIESNHQQVDYWQIQNEPDGDVGGQRATPTQALDVFQAGVDAVRSVDPAARIVGPALAAYNDQPAMSTTLDMVTFLNYVVAHNIRLEAVSWHEVGAAANAVDLSPDPQSVVTHVQSLRRLLAARPSLGQPAIFINEYASAAEHLIPGWDVAWIGALEAAGVTQANRSCWHQMDGSGHLVGECNKGSLDGLFIPGTGLPEAGYQVHLAYAKMLGSRVAASSTDAAVTAVATRDDRAQTMTALLGRHQSCTAAVRVDCTQPASATPPPEDVQVTVAVPWTARNFHVTLQRIPNQPGAVAAPVTVLQTTVPGPGPVSLTVPGFADGDAYVVAVTAA